MFSDEKMISTMDDFHGGLRQPNFSYEESNIGMDSNLSWENDFSGLHREDFGEMIRWKSGKRVDPRLLVLLESFGEIYVRRHEFFKKIFPETYEDFVAVFKKTGNTSRKNKGLTSFRTLGRSRSLGLKRPERFKVRTPKVIVVAGGDGQGDQSDKGGNNNSKNSFDELLKWVD